MAAPLTPRRVYLQSNVCVLCGFSFVNKEIKADGTTVIIKHTNQKLKISTDRRFKMEEIVGNLPSLAEKNDNGVCLKCYRLVEKVGKLKSDQNNIIEKLRSESKRVWTRLSLDMPSPKIQKPGQIKRLLKSPATSQPEKHVVTDVSQINKCGVLTKDQLAVPLLPMSTVIPIKLMPFGDLTNMVNISNNTTTAGSTLTNMIIKQPPIIAPKPHLEPNRLGKTIKKSLAKTFHLDESDDTFKESKPKESKEDDFIAQVAVNFPSGIRKRNFHDENGVKICKALCKGDADKQIVDILVKSNPAEIIRGAAILTGNEARTLCRKNSGSIFQQKSHKDFMTFNWDRINNELQIRAPYILRIISSIASDIPKQVDGYSIHTLCTVASALHARSSYMSFIQYVVGFVLTHGGCSKRDMERMCSLGFNVSPSSLQRKLTSWHEHLDEEVNNLHRGMMSEKNMRYQLVGDNWDKDLLPSYRTTDRGTISLHLFNVIAVKDRVPCTEEANADQVDLQPSVFMPSLQDQKQLENELVFLISTSIIHHLPALEDLVEVYPTHLNHPFSEYAGIKTEQHPLGLFDCDEKKTTDMIQLLGSLQDKYALLLEDGSVKEPIFFGGDRLTDERVQTAQEAMKNGGTQKERLEGFISKIEDFHRLMNFLEAIHKQVFSTESSSDRGTLYFFRNLLNARGVKGKVKNSYREHKMLYYTVLDAICCLLFLKESGMDDPEGDFLFPEEFPNFSNTEKVDWLNDMVRPIVQKYFFDGKSDILSDVREVISDPNHPENYWISNEQNGRLKCHHCEKSYVNVGSLKAHESKIHQVPIPAPQRKKKQINDELNNYILAVFKLVLLHRNLDSAVDMADGPRSVRSAMYELPQYNKTNKIKYAIGSIHLTALSKEGALTNELRQSLIANRFINLQGGKNNNMALDEYVELLNRDSKIVCKGFQTKESIIHHSKEYPILVNFVKKLESESGIRGRKGFHTLPNYNKDVHCVLKDLIEIDALSEKGSRKLRCRKIVVEKDIYKNTEQGLANLIHRHKPLTPYCRLRNPRL